MTKEQFIIKLLVGGNFEIESFMHDTKFIDESFLLMQKEYNNKVVWGFIGKRFEDKNFQFFFSSDINNISKKFDVVLDRENMTMSFKELNKL